MRWDYAGRADGQSQFQPATGATRRRTPSLDRRNVEHDTEPNANQDAAKPTGWRIFFVALESCSTVSAQLYKFKGHTFHTLRHGGF